MRAFWTAVGLGLFGYCVWAWLSRDPKVGELAGGYLAIIAAIWALYLRYWEGRLEAAHAAPPMLNLGGDPIGHAIAAENSRLRIERRFFNIALVAIIGAALQAYGPWLIQAGLESFHVPLKDDVLSCSKMKEASPQVGNQILLCRPR